MYIKRLSQCQQIMAGDGCMLKEILHPDRDPVDIGYSLANAWLRPGQDTLPHRLQQSEVYVFLRGEGVASIDGRELPVEAGTTVYVPPGALQHVKNTGSDNLEFLCVVDPPWRKEDEDVL